MLCNGYIILFLTYEFWVAIANDLSLDVDVHNLTQFSHHWENCVGSGHAALTTRADYREHLRNVSSSLGFRFVRFHAVLDNSMLFYDANKQIPSYFNVIQSYDYFLSIGVRPIVELSFTPLPVNNGTCNHFHYNGCENPPTDYVTYGKIIEDFVSVLLARYGENELALWYFEVYNEADLHWSFDTYYLLYEAAAKAVKRVSNRTRVGGPASAFPIWDCKLVDRCNEQHVPLDFISSHAYPTTGRAHPAEIQGLLNQILPAKECAKRGKIPLLVTEWNASPSSRDPYHDSPTTAAFVIASIDSVYRNVPDLEGFCYWAFSDVFSEQGFPAKNITFHGGFGLLNLYGVPKPAYRAFQMLHQLGNQRAHTSLNNKSNLTVFAVLGNNKNEKIIDILLANHGYKGQNITAQTLYISIKGVQLTNKQEAELWRIDSENCNPQLMWEHLGMPSYPSIIQLNKIMDASRPKVDLIPVRSIDDTLQMGPVIVPPFGSLRIRLNEVIY